MTGSLWSQYSSGHYAKGFVHSSLAILAASLQALSFPGQAHMLRVGGSVAWLWGWSVSNPGLLDTNTSSTRAFEINSELAATH